MPCKNTPEMPNDFLCCQLVEQCYLNAYVSRKVVNDQQLLPLEVISGDFFAMAGLARG